MADSDSIRDLVVRGTLTASVDSYPIRFLQSAIFDSELQDDIEHFEPYGFTGRPISGAEVLLVHLGGDRSHPICAVATDRRYRPANLKPGEVCVFDDLGRKVFLSSEGIKVEGVSSPVTVTTSSTVTVKASSGITLDAPTVTCTGNIVAKGTITDKQGSGGRSMDSMRSVYNSHTHNGGSKPDQGM